MNDRYRPHISIRIQVGDFPSDRDIHQVFPLSETITQEIMQPIDLPSSDAGFIEKVFICTRPDVIERIREKRKDFIKFVSESIAGLFTESVCKDDTVMGYKRGDQQVNECLDRR